MSFCQYWNSSECAQILRSHFYRLLTQCRISRLSANLQIKASVTGLLLLKMPGQLLAESAPIVFGEDISVPLVASMQGLSLDRG